MSCLSLKPQSAPMPNGKVTTHTARRQSPLVRLDSEPVKLLSTHRRHLEFIALSNCCQILPTVNHQISVIAAMQKMTAHDIPIDKVADPSGSICPIVDLELGGKSLRFFRKERRDKLDNGQGSTATRWFII